MKQIDINTSAIVYNSIDELSKEDKNLMLKAVEARKKAYAPYSKFNVGAAFLLENNTVILGNNQENAAYPSGMCAERVGVWKVNSEFPGATIKKLAITAASENSMVNKPVGPCGACRQTLSEYEMNQKKPIEIIFMGETGNIIKVNSLLSLLPFSFDSTYL